jgi:hypothetical protein
MGHDTTGYRIYLSDAGEFVAVRLQHGPALDRDRLLGDDLADMRQADYLAGVLNLAVPRESRAVLLGTLRLIARRDRDPDDSATRSQ